VIKSKSIRWAGQVASLGEMRKAYKISVRKPEPTGRPRKRWEDNIKIDLKETGYNSVEWTPLAQGRD